jgi:hypothetical protein
VTEVVMIWQHPDGPSFVHVEVAITRAKTKPLNRTAMELVAYEVCLGRGERAATGRAP